MHHCAHAEQCPSLRGVTRACFLARVMSTAPSCNSHGQATHPCTRAHASVPHLEPGSAGARMHNAAKLDYPSPTAQCKTGSHGGQQPSKGACSQREAMRMGS